MARGRLVGVRLTSEELVMAEERRRALEAANPGLRVTVQDVLKMGLARLVIDATQSATPSLVVEADAFAQRSRMHIWLRRLIDGSEIEEAIVLVLEEVPPNGLPASVVASFAHDLDRPLEETIDEIFASAARALGGVGGSYVVRTQNVAREQRFAFSLALPRGPHVLASPKRSTRGARRDARR